MSSSHSKTCSLLMFCGIVSLGLAGCMHPAGMGPGYASPYQPMYGAPGMMNAPGTYVVPQTDAPLYAPANGGAGSSTFEANPGDGFDAPGGSGANDGGVPAPRDPGAGGSGGTNGNSNSPFFQDIPSSGGGGV
ncbi:MAG: hypothetical protein JNL58_16045 [Planctomyces sp.]|nr:hypothetical protein [Planctomyces sp.]